MPSNTAAALRFDDLVRGLRFAARGLRRAPVFTLVATASLAVPFSLTSSTVSIVNAYLIRSLPYPNAQRLYHVRYAPPGPWEPSGMTGLDWTTVEDVVEFPVASSGESFYLTERGSTLALRGLRVTQGFVEGLGVSVVVGRRLMAQDFVPGAEPVVLIGHALWRDRFGSDPDAIGRIVRSEPESRPGRPETFRIVGVLSPGFYYGRDSRTSLDLLLPSTAPVRAYMVRLRQGVPPAAAERRLTEAAREDRRRARGVPSSGLPEMFGRRTTTSTREISIRRERLMGDTARSTSGRARRPRSWRSASNRRRPTSIPRPSSTRLVWSRATTIRSQQRGSSRSC
jgi:hypothetical protein